MGTSVHCRSPMLEAMESFVTTQLKLMFILEENNLNLTQRYLGWALAGFFLDFCVFFFPDFGLIFCCWLLTANPKKTTGKEETLTLQGMQYIVRDEGKRNGRVLAGVLERIWLGIGIF